MSLAGTGSCEPDIINKHVLFHALMTLNRRGKPHLYGGEEIERAAEDCWDCIAGGEARILITCP